MADSSAARVGAKRVVCALAAWIFLFSFALDGFCAGIDIDGMPNNLEWDGTQIKTFVEQGDESNCGVTFATLRSCVRNEENAAYFAFMVLCDGLTADNLLCGVSVKLGDSDPMVVTAGNSPFGCDVNLYSFDAAVRCGSHGDFMCEMRIGFKYGVPRSTPVEIRVLDAAGEPSTAYFYSLVNEEYSEPTTELLGVSESTKEPAEDAATTKAKTTKATTKATTTAEETRTRYSRPERTRRETTARQTEKSTKASAKATEKVTAKPTTRTTAATTANVKSAARSATASDEEITSVIPVLQYAQSPEEPKRRQTALTVGGGIALAALVIWSLLPGRRSEGGEGGTEKDESP